LHAGDNTTDPNKSPDFSTFSEFLVGTVVFGDDILIGNLLFQSCIEAFSNLS